MIIFSEGTHLHRAVRLGDASAVRAFVRRGDDVNATDDYGYTAIHYSAVSGVSEIAVALLTAKGVRVNQRTPFHHTPLFLAAMHNHYNIFSLLLSRGADPNTEIMLGQTVLHWTVKRGMFKYVKDLIDHGADVNILDCFFMSPLRIHLQATMDLHITKLLVINGADINETKFESTTILKIALYRWRQDMNQNFRLLMRYGADINASNFIGDTVLHFAARASAPSIVKLLVIVYDADITVRNKLGHTPLDVALQFGDSHTIETIRKLEADEIEEQMLALGI